MLCIIAGSRDAMEPDVIYALDHCPWRDSIKSVMSGTSWGADRHGERWAKSRGLEVVRFPAEWDQYGMSAGPRRNKEMAENADCLVAVWNGYSCGTKSMIDSARKKSVKTMIYYYSENRISFPEEEEVQLSLF